MLGARAARWSVISPTPDKMRLVLVSLVSLLVARGTLSARKLPPGVKACSRSDPKLSECLVQNANIAMPLLADGVQTYGLPKYEPLHVDEIHIDDSGAQRQLSVNLKMSDVDFYGLRDKYLTTARVDLKNNMISWKGVIPRLQLIGKYEISGHVLILPIAGKGAMNISLNNVEFSYSFRIKHESKNGKDFGTPIDSQLSFNAGGAKINLEGLFNGDKRLGDHMNVFLNENWKDVIQDIGAPISEVLNSAATQIIGRVFSLVPFDSVFTQ